VPVFVDTNLFVYRYDTTEPEKQRRAERWLDHLWTEGTGRVSIQGLQELYSSLTRKLDNPMEPAEARSVVRSLLSWDPAPVEARTIEGAWLLQDRYSLAWWDALIVSAAQITGCRHLLTEDLSHDQHLDGVRVVDPFRTGPGELGRVQPSPP
jgi:predicted nucleic acid-binding protein